MSESKIPVGDTGKDLRTFLQTTAAGAVHTEAVALVDPADPNKILLLHDAAPPSDAVAVPVRMLGNIVIGTSVEINNDVGDPIPVEGTVSVDNFPAPYGLTNTELRAAPVPVDTGLAQGVQEGGSVSVNGVVNVTGSVVGAGQVGAWSTGRTWALASGTDSVAAVQGGAWSVAVNNFPATYPVTGTFWQATQPVSAAALPLPAGAATSANQQTDALTNTQLRAAPVPVSGTVSTGGLTNAELRATAVPVSAASLPLPANAAAETGGNLAAIAGKDFATQTTLALIKANTDNIPAQGQALAAASLPVVLTAAQVTTLTPPAAIAGFALEATLGTRLAAPGSITALSVNSAASGNIAIRTPAAGKAVRLWWYQMTALPTNGAVVVASLRFGAAGTLFGSTPLSQYGSGISHSFKAGQSYVQGAVDEVLYGNMSANQTCYFNADVEDVP